MKLTLGFRARILLVVTALAIFPLVLTGFWLTTTAARSGQELLETRMAEYLEDVARRVATNWRRTRSGLLFLGEDVDVQRHLEPPGSTPGGSPPAGLLEAFSNLRGTVTRATIRDLDGRALWTLEQTDEDDTAPRGPVLVVELDIHRRFPGGLLGKLEAYVDADTLFTGSNLPTVAGAVLTASDSNRGTPLLGFPFGGESQAEPIFTFGGDRWLRVTHELAEPPLRLVAAAPMAPFTQPFEDAANRGSLWLAGVALAGLLSAALITGRLTRRLENLATAAESVSRGNLETRLDEGANDESGRVARAFNSMTASLRQTLEDLAARERFAAVGKFAAELAHEVRNPLTAIRINLQEVEESLPPDSPLLEPQQRALQEIDRLDATVRETLDRSRGTASGPQGVELAPPLRAAIEAARPAFHSQSVTLETPRLDDTQAVITGYKHSGASLEQLFLNLLLNAAAALRPGDGAAVCVRIDDDFVTVEISDSGRGIPDDALPQVFEPLYTTRADGTGLGLTVARRIVEEHGGQIAIESEVGKGTTVCVSLPLVLRPDET